MLKKAYFPSGTVLAVVANLDGAPKFLDWVLEVTDEIGRVVPNALSGTGKL